MINHKIKHILSALSTVNYILVLLFVLVNLNSYAFNLSSGVQKYTRLILDKDGGTPPDWD